MVVAMQNEDSEFIQTNYDAIPTELKALKQWFCYKKQDRNGQTVKVNYNPLTGAELDTKVLFEFSACDQKASRGNYDGIGFYLDDTQKYAVISLNGGSADLTFIKKFEEIVSTINSYTEISPSGLDFKIWVKGRSENIINDKEIEIFSKNCYVYLTGNHLKAIKIEENQGYLDQIYKEVVKPNNILKFAELKAKEEKSDENIIKEIRNSKYENQYTSLKNNLWKGEFYNSLEEAEMAFIEIIINFTRNIEQIGRIYGESKIYDDAKGWVYYEGKINKCLSRVKQTPTLNLEAVLESIQIPKQKKLQNPDDILIPKEKVKALEKSISETEKRILEKEYEEEKEEVIKTETVYTELEYPPGFAGVIAREFFNNSNRQVKEISIIGALSLLSGIVGKSHNISNTGLNHYFMLLARSGIGKSEIGRGWNRIMGHVKKTLPQAKTFRGASGIASGQALCRDVAKYPSQCLIMGEFYTTIHKMSTDKAQSHDKDLLRVLCDYYTQSGKYDEVERIVYANSKDTIEAIKSPALSLVGECNPKDMYETINEKLIYNGLLPRFIMVHYRGDRKYMNRAFKNYEMPADFIKRIKDIADNSLRLNAMNEVIECFVSDEVEEYFNEIDDKTTDFINEIKEQSPTIDLWNRVHLKVLKLSGLLAVADNHLEPVVGLEHAKWAYNLILKDTQDLINKFDIGEIGATNESQRQNQDVVAAIKFYLNSKGNVLSKYRVNFDLQSKGIIGYSFIYQRISRYASFKNSRFPTPKLLKDCLKNLEDCGYIAPVFSKELKDVSGKSGIYYKVINQNVFRGRGE